MKHYLKIALAWSVALVSVPAVFFALLFSFGPAVETAVWPVITNVRATLVQRDDHNEILHLAALGKKVRSCEWKNITAMVYKNGVWQQGSVYFTDPRTHTDPRTAITISRPKGSQSLGEIFVFPAGDRVQVYLYHACHPLWQTTTFMYELDLTKTPHQVR